MAILKKELDKILEFKLSNSMKRNIIILIGIIIVVILIGAAVMASSNETRESNENDSNFYQIEQTNEEVKSDSDNGETNTDQNEIPFKEGLDQPQIIAPDGTESSTDTEVKLEIESPVEAEVAPEPVAEPTTSVQGENTSYFRGEYDQQIEAYNP